MQLSFSHLAVAVFAFLAGALWTRKRQEAERVPPEPPAHDAPADHLGWGERLFTIVFITGWLIAWSFGIFVAAAQLLTGAKGGAGVFLFGWLIGAIAGWFAAAHTLIQAIRGKRGTFTTKR